LHIFIPGFTCNYIGSNTNQQNAGIKYTTNVYHTVIKGFKDAGYEREYKDACKALLDAATNYLVHIDDATFAALTIP
jgi:hypothetical protein